MGAGADLLKAKIASFLLREHSRAGIIQSLAFGDIIVPILLCSPFLLKLENLAYYKFKTDALLSPSVYRELVLSGICFPSFTLGI